MVNGGENGCEWKETMNLKLQTGLAGGRWFKETGKEDAGIAKPSETSSLAFVRFIRF